MTGLQKESKNVPYVLGRITAYREKQDALTGLGLVSKMLQSEIQNGTCTKLTNLTLNLQAAAKTLPEKKKEAFNRLEAEIAKLHDLLDIEEYPERMTLEELGSFQLGYYHQKSAE